MDLKIIWFKLFLKNSQQPQIHPEEKQATAVTLS